MTVPGNVTVVAVHGAWADGSSWKDVILSLEREGLRVIAAPIPLTSLGDDAAALKRAIARTEGPVILAGHAYAGAVIATGNDERVKALVYIAGLAPDEGETVAEVFYRDQRHAQAPHLAPDGDGFIWMPEEGFRNAFAQHATTEPAHIIGSRAEADRAEVYSRAGSKTGVEIQAFLVPDCGRRPHDQPQNPTLHGGPHESYETIARCRPRTVAQCATKSCGHHFGSEAGSVLETIRSLFVCPNLQGKGEVVNSVAIVTGASQGIGRSTSIRLARDFSAVVLVARNTNALQDVADGVKTVGAEPLICDLDLSKIESAEALVKITLDRFGRIDALLNIAGAVPKLICSR